METDQSTNQSPAPDSQGLTDVESELRKMVPHLRVPAPDAAKVIELAADIVEMAGKFCSARHWQPTKGTRYEIEKVRDGHVFGWQFFPSLQSQVLICIICRKPYHDLCLVNA